MGKKFTTLLYFNPRLREGGDDKDGVEHEVKKISIHASEKEATTSHWTRSG